MRNSSRQVSPEKQVNRLEKKHAKLKQQVAELEGRKSLTPAESMRVQTLKKEKLATKDALIVAKQAMQ